MLFRLKNFINWVLPYQCLLCGKEAEENAIFCSNCFSKISFIEQPICSICGRMFEFTVNDIEETCNQCSDGTRFFDMARSLLHYDELSRQLIMKIKRHSDHITACTCVKMLHTRYSDILERCDLVVPVPSHWTRLLRRSYNPANIIAIELTKISGKKYKNVLKRSKKTEYQRAKSIIERINNVLDAFSCKFDLNGKSVVLVDDVMTTGATLNECAKVLKHAGAKKVICITIACTRALCFNFG